MLPLDLRVLLGEAEPPQPQAIGGRHATLADWLDLNAICCDEIRPLLGAGTPRCPPAQSLRTDDPIALPSTPDAAWRLCHGVMRESLPELAADADAIFAEAPRHLHPCEKKFDGAFTYDLGSDALPFISVSYRGTPKDLISMMHEFGHALQIAASSRQNDGQMPPVARECCAFLSELLLLERSASDVGGAALRDAWWIDNDSYLGADADVLRAALDHPDTPYCYAWNYPIARRLADRLFAHDESMRWSALFKAGRNAPDVVRRLTLDASN